MDSTDNPIASNGRPLAQAWQQRLAEWRSSGMTQVAYCRVHGLSRHAFQYWKKRLQEDLPPCRLIELPASIRSTPAPIEVLVGERFRACIPEGIDPEHLRAVLSVVAEL